MPPVKIALGIFSLDPRGGLEDSALRLAGELSRRGHEPVFFVARAKNPIPFPTVCLSMNDNAFTNHERMRRFGQNFVEASKRGFDKTVAFQMMAAVDVLFLADPILNRPNLPLWKRLTPRYQTLLRIEANAFGPRSKTVVLCLSSRQLDAAKSAYPAVKDRILVLPPTVSRDRVYPDARASHLRAASRSELGLPADAKVWLWLALQPHTKGLDRVIEALAKSHDAHLVVAGLEVSSLKLRPYRATVTRLGLEHRVHFVGYASDARLKAVLSASDVLAHPARADVTGGVILEAIVNGLPVVATSVCGFSDHISESGAGVVLQEPFDRDEFVRALARLCGIEAADYCRRGVEYADQNLFSGLARACDIIESTHPNQVTESLGRTECA